MYAMRSQFISFKSKSKSKSKIQFEKKNNSNNMTNKLRKKRIFQFSSFENRQVKLEEIKEIITQKLGASYDDSEVKKLIFYFFKYIKFIIYLNIILF
jgi:hypothetical protein